MTRHFPAWGAGKSSVWRGALLAHICKLNQVAQHLSGHANASSLERRLQRWLANEHRVMKVLFEAWVRWALHLWGQATLLILVDETKLSDHVSVMMVGGAYSSMEEGEKIVNCVR